VIPPVPGALGLPAESAGGEKLKAAIRRWRQQRQLRRAHSLERRVRARENLQNYKRFTGDI
jgi:hypothetical protein